MCYQAFIHFGCGHEQIIETTCHLAEGVALWWKQACPNYKQQSMYPVCMCGKGKFYCSKEEKDGPWLDATVERLALCEAQLREVDGKLEMLRLKVCEVFPFLCFAGEGGRAVAAAAETARAAGAALFDAAAATRAAAETVDLDAFFELKEDDARKQGVRTNFTISNTSDAIYSDAQQVAGFCKTADEQKALQQARESETFAKMKQMAVQLKQRKKEIEADQAGANHIMSKAKKWFAQRNAANLQNMQLSAFVPDGAVGTTFNKIPMELQPLMPPESLGPSIPEASHVAVTEQTIDASLTAGLTHQGSSSLVVPEHSNAYDNARVCRDSAHAGAEGFGHAQFRTLKNPATVGMPAGQSNFVAPTKRPIKQRANARGSRRGRGAAKDALVPGLSEEGGQVRRSTRARTQKVSYAESQGSDFSRESSPVKDDNSTAKSDWAPSASVSSSPQSTSKRAGKQPDRDADQAPSNAESLASKIGDWSRRTGNDNAASVSTPQQVEQVPDQQNFTEQAPDKQSATEAVATEQPLLKSSKHVKREKKSSRRRPSTAPEHSTTQKLKRGATHDANGRPDIARRLSGCPNNGFAAQYSNMMMPCALGLPFPDESNAVAVIGPNMYNMYRHNSFPGADQRPQSAPSFYPQPTTGYSTQQMSGYRFPQVLTNSNPAFHDHQLPRSSGNGNTAGTSMNGGMSQYQQQSGFSNPYYNAASLGYPPGLSQGFNVGPRNNYGYGGQTQNVDMQAGGDRADSVEGCEDSNRVLPQVNLSSFFDYDGMRRSFGANQELSPVKTPRITVTDTEPQKRTMSASSPDPPAKRVRLSLPGSEGANTDFSKNRFTDGDIGKTTTSSPAKISSQQASVAQMTTTSSNVNPVTPAPAPTMNPKDIQFSQTPAAGPFATTMEMPHNPTFNDGTTGDEQANGGSEDIFAGIDFDAVDWSVIDEALYGGE